MISSIEATCGLRPPFLSRDCACQRLPGGGAFSALELALSRCFFRAHYSAMKHVLSATRRRIIAMLRSGDRTVAELAGELGLTNNAVRSHLHSLQRQGLVLGSGFRAGTRKPHAAYALSAKARRAFFEGCEPLLSQLISVLSRQLSKDQFETALRDSGRRMAQACPSKPRTSSLRQRIRLAIAALQNLGGQAVAEHHHGKTVIRGTACPWAVLVADHPEVCLAAEALLAEMIEVPVSQQCSRGDTPQCVFRIG